jgi:hypothetical protein
LLIASDLIRGHVVVELGCNPCRPLIDGPYAAIEAVAEPADLAVDAIPHRAERGRPSAPESW